MDANPAGRLHLFDDERSINPLVPAREMEMIMSANLSAPTAVQRLTGPFWRRRLVEAVKRRWVAYQDWHDQQQAIAHLRSMSDAQLKDVGLVRSQIEIAVRAGVGPEHWQRVMHF